MTIRTGLSSTVAGHVLRVVRDDQRMTAEVVVECLLPSGDITAVQMDAVDAAARLLQQRAQRFLGRQWTVLEWDRAAYMQRCTANG